MLFKKIVKINLNKEFLNEDEVREVRTVFRNAKSSETSENASGNENELIQNIHRRKPRWIRNSAGKKEKQNAQTVTKMSKHNNNNETMMMKLRSDLMPKHFGKYAVEMYNRWYKNDLLSLCQWFYVPARVFSSLSLSLSIPFLVRAPMRERWFFSVCVKEN